MLIRSAEQDIERVLYTEKAIAARRHNVHASGCDPDLCRKTLHGLHL